jgi:hypothetical protein
VAVHARARFAKRPDFKQPSLLREGLDQLQAGCVSAAVDTLRKVNPRAPAVRAALNKAEAMLTDLGSIATVGQVAKWEWAHSTKARLSKLSAGVEDALGDEESEWLKSESVQSWNRLGSTAESEKNQQQATVPLVVSTKDTAQQDDEGDPVSPVFSQGDVSPDVAATAREFGFLPPERQNAVSDEHHAPSPWPTIKRAASQTPNIAMPALSSGRRCKSAQQASSTPSLASPGWERLFNSEEPSDAAVAQARNGRRRGNTKTKARKKLAAQFSGKPASAPAVTVPQAQISIYENGLLSEIDVKQGRKHRRKAATPITSASAWQPGESCQVVERTGKPRVRDRKVSSDTPLFRAALAEAAQLEKRSRNAATCKTNGKLLKRAVYGSEL